MWREHNIVYVHIIHSYSHIIWNSWASWANGYYLTSIITLSALVSAMLCRYTHVARTFLYTCVHMCVICFTNKFMTHARARSLAARGSHVANARSSAQPCCTYGGCYLNCRSIRLHMIYRRIRMCSVHLELKCKKSNNNNNKNAHKRLAWSGVSYRIINTVINFDAAEPGNLKCIISNANHFPVATAAAVPYKRKVVIDGNCDGMSAAYGQRDWEQDQHQSIRHIWRSSSYSEN